MQFGDILILKGEDILSLLVDREGELINIVQKAYEEHALGSTSLPHSVFLNFQADRSDRIIALPAYLGNGFEVAGIKWVSSFPANIERGIDRASAVMILNSTTTGAPEAVLEGSIISAKRTAASAALAAKSLIISRKAVQLGIIGCGLINFETFRFLLTACPEITNVFVFDIDKHRAEKFKSKCQMIQDRISIKVVEDIRTIMQESSLISIATTATKPYIFDFSDCQPGATVLHISLRDLAPEVILSCDNVVDDIDHVSRANTSIHLTEQLVRNLDFVNCNLADALIRKAVVRKDDQRIVVFSPFGLGILDLAVAKLAYDLAREQGVGMLINSFLPTPWGERDI